MGASRQRPRSCVPVPNTMVKNNNVIPNGHFHKDWENRVKTWVNQPARKLRRRQNRVKKALAVAPRPTSTLKPVVQCQTLRYNMRTRHGRGFTLEELKEAGINRKVARTIGISVDHRRQNKSEESLKANVQRLKEYKSKLVVFPRKAGKPKFGDAEAAECSAAVQATGTLLPMAAESKRIRARVITDEEKAFKPLKPLQHARSEQRITGTRERILREKEEAAK